MYGILGATALDLTEKKKQPYKTEKKTDALPKCFYNFFVVFIKD